MPATVLMGLQWGDEGKGKITDYLARSSDMVVRFGGGDNAGHTLKIGGEYFFNHLLPSGILYRNVKCVIGNGVVVNPDVLRKEILKIMEKGYSAENLCISDKCNIITEYHLALDAMSEKTNSRIGTTKRGIGPAYMDKIGRSGIRFCDIANGTYAEKLAEHLDYVNFILVKYYGGKAVRAQAAAEKLFKQYNALKKYVCRTEYLVNEYARKNKNILFEGAQGAFLDIDFGTYPFVTSSSTYPGGAVTGSGLPPKYITKVTGVVKAYTTRVGEGPFPTELKNADGEALRKKGGEYGTTTGRPRRTGWLDLFSLKYSVMLSGASNIALTKLDILSGFKTIKVATAYKIGRKLLEHFPSDAGMLGFAKPVYEELPGWKEDISGIKVFDDLPSNAKKYVKFIERYLGTPANIISSGAGRYNTIER